MSEFNQNYMDNMGNNNMEYFISIWILYEHWKKKLQIN